LFTELFSALIDSIIVAFYSLTQGWPNYDTRAASGSPTSLIRPAKYLAHFSQAPRFELWTAVQQYWLLPVSCWLVCRSSAI